MPNEWRNVAIGNSVPNSCIDEICEETNAILKIGVYDYQKVSSELQTPEPRMTHPASHQKKIA